METDRSADCTSEISRTYADELRSAHLKSSSLDDFFLNASATIPAEEDALRRACQDWWDEEAEFSTRSAQGDFSLNEFTRTSFGRAN